VKISDAYFVVAATAGERPADLSEVTPLRLRQFPLNERDALMVIHHEYDPTDRGKTFHVHIGILDAAGNLVWKSRGFRKAFQQTEELPEGPSMFLVSNCWVQLLWPGEYRLALTVVSPESVQIYRFPLPVYAEGEESGGDKRRPDDSGTSQPLHQAGSTSYVLSCQWTYLLRGEKGDHDEKVPDACTACQVLFISTRLIS